MKKTLAILLLFALAALATSVTGPALTPTDPGDPTHPDTTNEQLLAAAAGAADLDPGGCVLVFAVERKSMMTVQQGYAVALYSPEEMVAVAALVDEDLCTVDEISYRYSFTENELPLVRQAAEAAGPFQVNTPDAAFLVIGTAEAEKGWTVIVLDGWDGANNRWSKRVFEGIEPAAGSVGR
jgi:hypothetical protein